jgi:hypothetical protein
MRRLLTSKLQVQNRDDFMADGVAMGQIYLSVS